LEGIRRSKKMARMVKNEVKSITMLLESHYINDFMHQGLNPENQVPHFKDLLDEY